MYIFIHKMHNLYSSFDIDTSNGLKLHCIEFKHTEYCYTISKFSLR